MDDKEFYEMMERKRAEAEKPGYGDRCAKKAAKRRRQKRKHGDKTIEELILS